jgi:hypothetical protein
MTRKAKHALMGLVGVVAAAFAVDAVAHEGHDHKVMGTVSVIHEHHLEVKAKDGKTTTFVLNADTKVLRDKTPIKAADIKVGDRVVVTAAQAKEGLVAKEIRVGATAQTTAGKP